MPWLMHTVTNIFKALNSSFNRLKGTRATMTEGKKSEFIDIEAATETQGRRESNGK